MLLNVYTTLKYKWVFYIRTTLKQRNISSIKHAGITNKIKIIHLFCNIMYLFNKSDINKKKIINSLQFRYTCI